MLQPGRFSTLQNIIHTVRYTERSPERFKDFWED
jgi:hypothetical protein